jgi:hypothetical protein
MHVQRRKGMEQVTDLLLKRLSTKGVFPDEVPWFVRDVLYAVGNAEEPSVSAINRSLSILGWDKEILDEFSLALIMYLIEKRDEHCDEQYL